tara:strand:- start:30 stop:260 length:231 start_codon:yes stop_codon:yes gene_type:complete
VLLINFLGFEEVFKIIKSPQKLLDPELDISRKWASQNYSILKKTTTGTKSSGSLQIFAINKLRPNLISTLYVCCKT